MSLIKKKLWKFPDPNQGQYYGGQQGYPQPGFAPGYGQPQPQGYPGGGMMLFVSNGTNKN